MQKVWLAKLEEADREQFILDNQEAFRYGAMTEAGLGSEDTAEDEIISRGTIEHAIQGGLAYRIHCDGETAGGLVLTVDGSHGNLELLFVHPRVHSKGIGYAAWCEVERLFPEVTVWETCTPYFEKRNIHFYVNRCGFHIVEFFHERHPDPNDVDAAEGEPAEMFRFEKVIRQD